MELYVTSKNSGPTWSGTDPISLVYLGTSLDDAIASVGEMARYEREPGSGFGPGSYETALPREIIRETVKWYAADGYWYHIEKFEMEEA